MKHSEWIVVSVEIGILTYEFCIIFFNGGYSVKNSTFCDACSNEL